MLPCRIFVCINQCCYKFIEVQTDFVSTSLYLPLWKERKRKLKRKIEEEQPLCWWCGQFHTGSLCLQRPFLVPNWGQLDTLLRWHPNRYEWKYWRSSRHFLKVCVQWLGESLTRTHNFGMWISELSSHWNSITGHLRCFVLEKCNVAN